MNGKLSLLILSLILIVSIIGVSNANSVCTNNWLGGECVGSITYTSTTTLANNINATGNVIINSGVSLNSNTYSIWLGGNFVNNGYVFTANNPSSFGGGNVLPAANNFLLSYGGSGGGGGNGPNPHTDGNGGSTLFPGGAGGGLGSPGSPGSTGTTIPVTNANILLFYNAGWQSYLEGAGGGGAACNQQGNGNGGTGGYGIYIQASNIVAGNIITNSLAAATSCVFGGGGGGGAGGSIILAYNGVYTAGTYNVLGNAGAGSGAGGYYSGGTGGNGIVQTYQYITPPLNPYDNGFNSVTIVPVSATIALSTSITYSGSWVGGFGPFTAVLEDFATNTCTGTGVLYQTAISNTNSITFQPATPLTSGYFCIEVTDSLGFTGNSLPSQLTVTSYPPVNTISGNVPIPNANAICILTNVPPNQVTCSGNDRANMITTWVVNIYNSSGFAGLFTISSLTFTGNYFSNTVSPVYPGMNPITWVVTASSNSVGYTSWQGSFASNTHATTFYTPLDTLLTVVFLLVGIVVGSATSTQHKLSTTLFVEGLMLVFLYIVGLTYWLGIGVTAGLVLFCVVIGILGYSQENKTVMGG